MTKIESAFIKANTLQQMIKIHVPSTITKHIHSMNTIKIKMEVDTHPPGGFTTEVRNLMLPIPFTVLTLRKEDLFAGKMHAVLCRKWKNRTKGRDWYDLYWYISRNIAVNLTHLKARLVQSGNWEKSESFSREDLIKMLQTKIDAIDFSAAKSDVIKFIKDKDALDLWSPEFFIMLSEKLQVESVHYN